jgi:hypothetical protein
LPEEEGAIAQVEQKRMDEQLTKQEELVELIKRERGSQEEQELPLVQAIQ